MAGGIDIIIVSRIPGHASVVIVEVYTEVLDDIVFEKIKRLRLE
jgi:hypothetical protein